MRAARDQLEKLVHILFHLVYPSVHLCARICLTAVDTRRDVGASTERTVCGNGYSHDAYICRFNCDFLAAGWTCRENSAQEYSTGYAQDLDEIRALWMAMAQRREALTVRDAHAMFALTATCRSSWLGPLARTPVSRTAAHQCILINDLWVMLILVCLQELLSTEEKIVHKLELDREKNSVIHLTQAKADCEGIAFLHLHVFR